jgi:PAS domain S-box-containing protein
MAGLTPKPDIMVQLCNLTYHDGTSRSVPVSDVEIPFLEGRLIVSRTDLCGIITHANDAFVEMSGYERHELIGAPHHILRHPDMPRRAFRELWEALQERKKWHGYVKNLRKDGSYYWVYATVIPNVRNGMVVGYTSVRRKPSRARIAEIQSRYQQWQALEQGTEQTA